MDARHHHHRSDCRVGAGLDRRCKRGVDVMTPRQSRKAFQKAIAKERKKNRVVHVRLEHDDWCGVFSGSECHCNPVRCILDQDLKVKHKFYNCGFYDGVSFAAEHEGGFKDDTR